MKMQALVLVQNDPSSQALVLLAQSPKKVRAPKKPYLALPPSESFLFLPAAQRRLCRRDDTDPGGPSNKQNFFAFESAHAIFGS